MMSVVMTVKVVIITTQFYPLMVHKLIRGRVIGLRFAVFGHFLCGYLRFRGFWAIFLRFCGFGKTAAVLRFLAIFTCGLRY